MSTTILPRLIHHYQERSNFLLTLVTWRLLKQSSEQWLSKRRYVCELGMIYFAVKFIKYTYSILLLLHIRLFWFILRWLSCVQVMSSALCSHRFPLHYFLAVPMNFRCQFSWCRNSVGLHLTWCKRFAESADLWKSLQQKEIVSDLAFKQTFCYRYLWVFVWFLQPKILAAWCPANVKQYDRLPT